MIGEIIFLLGLITVAGVIIGRKVKSKSKGDCCN